MSVGMLDTLFSKHSVRYREIEDIAKQVSAVYCGNSIPGERIFQIIENYAKKNNIPIQILRFPFTDLELWAFTFLKQGTIFLCINTSLPANKQLFAASHELYHIYCFVEDVDQNCIRKGSVLKESIANDSITENMEELEANAFSGLLMMPSQAVREQLDILGFNPRNIDLDDILTMMEIFAMPYKATILRLFECGIISLSKMTNLYVMEQKKISDRISKPDEQNSGCEMGRGQRCLVHCWMILLIMLNMSS